MIDERKQFEQIARSMGLNWSEERIEKEWQERQAAIGNYKAKHPETWDQAESQAEQTRIHFESVRESNKPQWKN